MVKLLNGIFSRFDEVVLEHSVEKIKTIGDAYMVVAGLPEARADHAQILVDMSAKFIEIASEYNDHEGKPIEIRIGIHSITKIGCPFRYIWRQVIRIGLASDSGTC